MDSLAAPSVGDSDAPAEVGAPGRADLHARKVEERSFVAACIVSLLAFTVPLAGFSVLWASASPFADGDWGRRIQVAPFDGILVLAVLWTLINLHSLVDLFRSRSVRWVSGAFAVVFAASLAVNFSLLGVSVGLRLFAGLCVIATTADAVRTPRGRSITFGAVAIAGVLQTALAVGQVLHGDTFNVEPFDYNYFLLFQFGSSYAGQGGLPHPYHLASFLIVCQGAALLGLRWSRPRGRGPWLVALAIMGIGLAITYSRAAALGQIALLVCAALGRRDRRILLPAAVAIVIGLGIGAVGFGDGWYARADTTSGATADSDRGLRLREARELIERNPYLGVGPGRYVDELVLEKLNLQEQRYQPADNLVAHEAAEFGVVGGVLMLAFLGLLGLRALRGGAWTSMLVLPMIPMLLLGSTGYVLATSFAVSALWLAMVRASLDPVPVGDPDPEPDPGPAPDPSGEPQPAS